MADYNADTVRRATRTRRRSSPWASDMAHHLLVMVEAARNNTHGGDLYRARCMAEQALMEWAAPNG